MRHFTRSVGHIYNRLADAHLYLDYDEHGDFMNVGYWHEGTQCQREACESLMERLLAFIPKKKGPILDVACGKGATTRYLLKYYRPEDVVGINISDKQLAICRKNAPGCTFLSMDATQLDFPDHSFDNVICVEAAMHFDTREDFLREAYRVLKPGGRLVLSDLILSLQSAVQPLANYVRSPLGYKRVCLLNSVRERSVGTYSTGQWRGCATWVLSAISWPPARREATHKRYSKCSCSGDLRAALLFILSPSQSFTSTVYAILGQHPRIDGLLEMNLFLTKCMAQ